MTDKRRANVLYINCEVAKQMFFAHAYTFPPLLLLFSTISFFSLFKEVEELEDEDEEELEELVESIKENNLGPSRFKNKNKPPGRINSAWLRMEKKHCVEHGSAHEIRVSFQQVIMFILKSLKWHVRYSLKFAVDGIT
jgi:hypothetical protein